MGGWLEGGTRQREHLRLHRVYSTQLSTLVTTLRVEDKGRQYHRHNHCIMAVPGLLWYTGSDTVV